LVNKHFKEHSFKKKKLQKRAKKKNPTLTLETFEISLNFITFSISTRLKKLQTNLQKKSATKKELANKAYSHK